MGLERDRVEAATPPAQSSAVLKRVEGAGADIAVDDAESTQRLRGKAAAVGVLPGSAGSAAIINAALLSDGVGIAQSTRLVLQVDTSGSAIHHDGAASNPIRASMDRMISLNVTMCHQRRELHPKPTV
jgi:hypothetical protein